MSRKTSQNHRTRHGHPKGGRGRLTKSQRRVQHSHGVRKLKAIIQKNPKGFAFLIFDQMGVEDIFIPPQRARSLFQGDRVLVTLDSGGEVSELQILEHRFKEIVGRFMPDCGAPPTGGLVVVDRKKMREEIQIPPLACLVHKQRPKVNDWVRVALQFSPSGRDPVTGKLLEIFGQDLPPSADIGMISSEFNLTEKHSEEAENEATALPGVPDPKDIGAPFRKDLRPIPFITIDGETARDFDDAIHVERDKSGYVLWVAIADVSHYVQPGSALDKDAKERGTSVYFPERAFHMLPRALSENLCSLKPQQPRLTLTVKIKMDRFGNPTSTELYESVIESRRRATYTEIQKEWETNRNDPHWEYAPHFSLYQALRQRRIDRGSIDFDLPEAELFVQPNGEVVSITQRARCDSHRLIEEFMIAANEAVTEWIMRLSWPFIYRIHDDPTLESLDGFRTLAATVGVKFTMEMAKDPKLMSEIIRRLQGHAAKDLLNMAFLRSLKQAVYSSTHGTHYGLASEAYTHFTSPIRRYPDLVVHRMLRMALRHKGKHPSFEQLEQELEEIAEHCSYRERLAAEAERESIRLKQVRLMRAHLGNEFEAKIIGFSQSGMFAQLANPYCEGMIPFDLMGDDYYEYIEERMTVTGRKTRKTFRIGESLVIQVVSADLERRQVTFKLVTTPSN